MDGFARVAINGRSDARAGVGNGINQESKTLLINCGLSSSDDSFERCLWRFIIVIPHFLPLSITSILKRIAFLDTFVYLFPSHLLAFLR